MYQQLILDALKAAGIQPRDVTINYNRYAYEFYVLPARPGLTIADLLTALKPLDGVVDEDARSYKPCVTVDALGLSEGGD